jgi:hypothetical protein
VIIGVLKSVINWRSANLPRKLPVGIPAVDSSQTSDPALFPKILDAQLENDIWLKTFAPQGLVHFEQLKVSSPALPKTLHPEHDSKNVPNALHHIYSKKG